MMNIESSKQNNKEASLFLAIAMPLFIIFVLWFVMIANIKMHWLILFMPTIVTFLFYKYNKRINPEDKVVNVSKNLLLFAVAVMILRLFTTPYIIVKGRILGKESQTPISGIEVSVDFFAPSGFGNTDSQLVLVKTNNSGYFSFMKRTLPDSKAVTDSHGIITFKNEGEPLMVSGFFSLDVVNDYRYDMASTPIVSDRALEKIKKTDFVFLKIYDFGSIELVQAQNTEGGTLLGYCGSDRVPESSIQQKTGEFYSSIIPATCSLPREYGYNRKDLSVYDLMDLLELDIYFTRESVEKPFVWKLKIKKGGIKKVNCSLLKNSLSKSVDGQTNRECFSNLVDARIGGVGNYAEEIAVENSGIYIVKTHDGKFAKIKTQSGIRSGRMSIGIDIEYQPDGTFDLQNRKDFARVIPL